jgi:hypothetical protein
VERDREDEVGEREVEACESFCECPAERIGEIAEEAVFVCMQDSLHQGVPVGRTGENANERVAGSVVRAVFAASRGACAERTALFRFLREGAAAPLAKHRIRSAADEALSREQDVESGGEEAAQ